MRATASGQSLPLLVDVAKSKVNQGQSISLDDDVLGLDISMRNPSTSQVQNAIKELQEKLAGFLLG